MAATFEEEMKSALANQDRFEALALVNLKSDQLMFLQTLENVNPALKPALEAFLLRAVTNIESLEELQEDEDISYYDVDQRQIILNLINTKTGRYLFAAVVAPHKTYKQVMKRLVKSLKSHLSS